MHTSLCWKTIGEKLMANEPGRQKLETCTALSVSIQGRLTIVITSVAFAAVKNGNSVGYRGNKSLNESTQ